jgi:hypothetical protein
MLNVQDHKRHATIAPQLDKHHHTGHCDVEHEDDHGVVDGPPREEIVQRHHHLCGTQDLNGVTPALAHAAVAFLQRVLQRGVQEAQGDATCGRQKV